jgi:SAM-dependent MidA family methyltransferase
VAQKIASEIESRGAIPFSRFMELALYCPEYGFYEAERDITGRGGDFYTSVSVGPLFGELLGYQFCEWLSASNGQKTALRLIEAGAHDGRLATDLLEGIRQRSPEIFSRLEYWILEPSARRQAIQKKSLAFLGGQVRWARDFAELSALRAADAGEAPEQTVFFSNELLDAMPVNRFGWDAASRTWFEWGVTLREGTFAWARLLCDQSKIAACLDPGSTIDPNGFQLSTELLRVLPDSFTIDLSMAALDFWKSAAEFLRRGQLVIFDYGLEVGELFLPARREGTLRAYHRHHVSSDLLARPGEQDLTAHLNFTALQRAGEAAGLKTDLFLSQSQFLTRIAARFIGDPAAFGDWTAARTRQFQTLTHPEHLGKAFRVLVQLRN